MQGGSTGIGYGLKYQVIHSINQSINQYDFTPNFNQIHLHLLNYRHDVLRMWKPIQITPVSSPALSVSKKKMRFHLNTWSRICICLLFRFWFDWIEVYIYVCVCFRCIWLGFRLVVRNLFARVCFRILMRFGTLLLVLLINVSSPLFFLLVSDRFVFRFRMLMRYVCLLDCDCNTDDNLITLLLGIKECVKLGWEWDLDEI